MGKTTKLQLCKMKKSKNIILMLLIIGHSVLGVSFNNLKFSSEIDTNSLHAINNTIQYREQNLSIKIDKNHTVHD